MNSILFATPTWRPVGGVVKIMDYVTHALSDGIECSIWCPEPVDHQDPLWQIERFVGLRDVPTRRELPTSMPDGWLALISWPTHHDLLWPIYGDERGNTDIIHFVQNVRHANPAWIHGYAARLLTRPMPRIMTNTVVLDACAPLLNQSSETVTINLGHPSGYFTAPPRADHPKIRVGYTTWKSDVGDQTSELLEDDDRFEFRAIRKAVDWTALKELYSWSDVFLCCPNVEEGFYMPGLEAMEAGCIVVSPDVGGNMAYIRFGENALEVELDDAASYVRSLQQVADMSDSELAAYRSASLDAPSDFSLSGERSQFISFLSGLG